jgi:hypothetical protein
MASQIPGPRKQRTRQHVIADLSVHHVERFILEQGYTAQRLGSDYGYDLLVSTFDEQGYVEPGSIYFPFKAKETLDEIGTHYAFDMDIRDDNLWIREKCPSSLSCTMPPADAPTGSPSSNTSARRSLASPRKAPGV